MEAVVGRQKVFGTKFVYGMADRIAMRAGSRMRDASRRSADGPMPELTSLQEKRLGPRARVGTRRNVRRGRY